LNKILSISSLNSFKEFSLFGDIGVLKITILVLDAFQEDSSKVRKDNVFPENLRIIRPLLIITKQDCREKKEVLVNERSEDNIYLHSDNKSNFTF